LCISFAFLAFDGVVACTKSFLPILVTGLTGFGGTGLTGFGNRPDRFCPELALVQGEYAYVQGVLYALVVCALYLSIVLSQMCQAAALA
jgi:hypothetical protein